MKDDERLQRLRAICESLPGTSEAEAWHHPVFKTGGKTFLAYEPIADRPSVAFRLERDAVEILSADRRFFPTPYGRGLWISMWLDGRTPWKLVKEMARRSHAVVAGSPKR